MSVTIRMVAGSQGRPSCLWQRLPSLVTMTCFIMAGYYSLTLPLCRMLCWYYILIRILLFLVTYYNEKSAIITLITSFCFYEHNYIEFLPFGAINYSCRWGLDVTMDSAWTYAIIVVRSIFFLKKFINFQNVEKTP